MEKGEKDLDCARANRFSLKNSSDNKPGHRWHFNWISISNFLRPGYLRCGSASRINLRNICFNRSRANSAPYNLRAHVDVISNFIFLCFVKILIKPCPVCQ